MINALVKPSFEYVKALARLQKSDRLLYVHPKPSEAFVDIAHYVKAAVLLYNILFKTPQYCEVYDLNGQVLIVAPVLVTLGVRNMSQRKESLYENISQCLARAS